MATELRRPARPEAPTVVRTQMRDARREAFLFTQLGECVLAGQSILTDLEATRRFAAWLVAAGAAVLFLGLGGGWWLASRALRPLEDISGAAGRISEAQTTLARERNASGYRQAVASCLDTAQQMRRLTQSLLERARYDAGQESLDGQRFDLEGRTRACI